MNSSTNGLSYSKPLSEKKDAGDVKKNQTSEKKDASDVKKNQASKKKDASDVKKNQASEKKDASDVKKNQASNQTRKGLAYNTTGDPPSAANTKSTKSQTINAPNFSYG